MSKKEKRKKIPDMAKEDANWKAYIRAEDDSGEIWRNNWGWLVDEYSELKKKLDEKTKQSVFLSTVKVLEKEDNRKLERIPPTTNHMYGWLASQKDFVLQKYGSDTFKPLLLPELYVIDKRISDN